MICLRRIDVKEKRGVSMNDLLIAGVGLICGAFTWGLLVLSDWLLGSKP
jgi:hypothetical protein